MESLETSQSNLKDFSKIAMGSLPKPVYAFGPFRLDADQRILTREGQPVPLTPKVIDTLLTLVERHGRIVEKDDLMKAVWRDTVVEESNLAQNVFVLRKMLGNGTGGGPYIETIPRRGYRFVAAVRELRPESAEPVSARHTKWQITNALTEAEQQISGQEPGGGTLIDLQVVPPAYAPGSLTRDTGTRFLRSRAALVAATAGLSLVAASVGGWQLFAPQAERTMPRQPFQNMAITRVTYSGDVAGAAVSRDGKYIVHAIEREGRRGLWLRQVATAGSVPIVPEADAEYWSLAFSPDSNYIYYVAWTPNESDAALYRVSVLGGTPQLISNIATIVGFSPDGQRMAYLDQVLPSRDTRLVVARADGTQPRVLAKRPERDTFWRYQSDPVWSPDGSVIVCAAAVPGSGGLLKNLVAVRLADGSETPIGSKRWATVGRIAWLSDGSGLVVAASDERWSPRQVWHVSYPDGETRRITNDVNDYRDLSVTGDSRTLIAVQTGSSAGLWLAPQGDTSLPRRVASQVGTYDGVEGMSWNTDGRLLFRSNTSGNWDIWALDPATGERRQLTFDSHSDLHPSASRGGRFVIFSSDRSGRFHVWRMETDGSNPTQLTEDEGVYAQLSPDGRWVVYQQGFAWFTKHRLLMVPIDGGKSVALTDRQSMRPAISPDGKLIAHYYLDTPYWRIGLIPFQRRGIVKSFEIPPSSGSRILRWTHDGRALGYIDSRDGVSNIWVQPIDGSARKQVTDFKSDAIFDFSWSPDGKYLAYLRGTETSDIVQITEPRD